MSYYPCPTPCPTPCPVPCPTDNFQPAGYVYPHNLWSTRHPDTTSIENPIKDGDTIIYRRWGPIPNRFIPTGSVNLALGEKTLNGSGLRNIMLGSITGAAYTEGTGLVSTVTGNDNIVEGSNAGNVAVAGSGNVILGLNAGPNVLLNCICIGENAGRDVVDTPTVSGSNNIYLNATGGMMHSSDSGGCFIKPIKPYGDLTPFSPLYYNPSTGELAYQSP